MNSTHKVEVIEISKIEKHPNADTLDIISIDGYQVVVKSGDFKIGDLAAYVCPDNVLPDKPEYNWLKGNLRVKARKLRGIWSLGLLLPAPEGASVGEDLTEVLGIKPYVKPDPKVPGSKIYRGWAIEGPNMPITPPKYDLEAYRKYAKVLEPSEPIQITEKIHGSSARYVFWKGSMYAGSKKEWKKEDRENVMWWKVLDHYAQIEDFCREHPGVTLYGEIYGHQDLKYNVPSGKFGFAAFDILSPEGKWLNVYRANDCKDAYQLPWVPVLEENVPYDHEKVLTLSEGRSTMQSVEHMREGVVVKPMVERYDRRCGRVALKLVSNEYLSK